MANKRTEKCNFPSRYANDTWVTPAQYICEYICEKKAQQDGKDLPHHFWQLKEWQTYFRSQVNTANKLLKKYEVKAIVAALKDKRTFRTYSLRAPWLEAIIIEHQRLLEAQREKARLEKVIKPVVTTQRPRQEKTKKNVLDLLDEIDNEQEET